MGVTGTTRRLKVKQVWLLVLIAMLVVIMMLIWYWYDQQLEQLDKQTTVLPVSGKYPSSLFTQAKLL